MKNDSLKAELVVVRRTLSELKPHPENPRIHPDPGTPGWEALKRSLQKDYFDPLGINSGKRCKKLKDTLWSGHLRFKVLQEMGVTTADVVVKDYTENEHLARMVAANRQVGEDNDIALANMIARMDGERLFLSMPEDDIAALLQQLKPPDIEQARRTLAEKFGVPPFSVLDARQGYWQERKRAWLEIGIQSELGRGGGGATPPHPPGVTQNADGTLNYSGSAGTAKRFDRQRQGPKANKVSPGGGPACDYSKNQRGDGHGRPMK